MLNTECVSVCVYVQEVGWGTSASNEAGLSLMFLFLLRIQIEQVLSSSASPVVDCSPPLLGRQRPALRGGLVLLSFCHWSPMCGIHYHYLVFVGMPDPMTA